MTNDNKKATDPSSSAWWRHFLAGGIAGAVSRTCTAPLDRIRIHSQVHGVCGAAGLRSCLQHMIKEGGVRSLWRGNGLNILKIAPESALKFMAYERAKQSIRRSNEELTISERFVAGSLAGAMSQTAIYPLEVMKTRMALRKTGEFTGILDAATKMFRKEGWKSFYKGYIPNLLGIIPYAGIDLAVYETLKNTHVKCYTNTDTPPVHMLLACGIISSTCGLVCTYPLALVRTRLQAQVGGKASMIDMLKSIVRQEGFAGLYRGITPNFLKMAPAASISYTVYEHCRQTLGVHMS